MHLGLTSGFDFCSCDHLGMTLVHISFVCTYRHFPNSHRRKSGQLWGPRLLHRTSQENRTAKGILSALPPEHGTTGNTLQRNPCGDSRLRTKRYVWENRQKWRKIGEIWRPVRPKPHLLQTKKINYRKQIARKLRTQYVEDFCSNSMTLKSRLRITQGHWKRNHWIDHIRL